MGMTQWIWHFFSLADLWRLACFLPSLAPSAFVRIIQKKKVGSSYWGVYKEADPTQYFGEVECAPLCDKQKTVYGALQYSQGKGVSRRGA
jgi:hypothetical protein